MAYTHGLRQTDPAAYWAKLRAPKRWAVVKFDTISDGYEEFATAACLGRFETEAEAEAWAKRHYPIASQGDEPSVLVCED